MKHISHTAFSDFQSRKCLDEKGAIIDGRDLMNSILKNGMVNVMNPVSAKWMR